MSTSITKDVYSIHSKPRTVVDSADADHEPLLMTILAHDLHNSLASLYGQLALLRKRAEKEHRPHDARLTFQATRSLDQMKHLIDNLLQTARLEHGIFELQLERVELCALAYAVVESFAGIDRAIVVNAMQPALITGDRPRLWQALHNLLANAVTHSPRHAPVELTLQTTTRAVVVRIRDFGPGIPPDLLPHLFQPFTPGPRSQGLGLGLYLAREIAVVHGGSLSVESERGKGTCFELALPADAGRIQNAI